MESKIIFGLGVDIVEVSRIKTAISRSKRFLERVFTEGERAYCINKGKTIVKYICLAQKFAAKEAVAKSLGTGFGKNLSFFEIEIKNLNSGKPYVELLGKARDYCFKNKIERIEISLSGTEKYAIAFAIALRG